MKLCPLNRRLCLRAIAFLLVSAAIVVVTQLLSAQAATTFTVNSLGDTPDEFINGVCADAGGQCTLRAALDEANFSQDLDTINFSVTGTINLTGPLPIIASDLTVNGPGPSQLTVRRNTGGDYRVLALGNNSTVNISGLTISNGKTPDAPSGQTAQPGGGITSVGNLTLTNVVVTGNRTGNGGSVGNTSGGWGGFGAGISAGGRLTLINVTVSNNITGNGATGTNGGTGGSGAGIAFGGIEFTMIGGSVTGNTTGNGATGTNNGASGGNGGSGGGIQISGGTVTLTSVLISGNTTGHGNSGSGGGDGGGIAVINGDSTLVNVTVSNNNTGDGGGGFIGQGGFGGGMYNSGTVHVKNSVVHGNTTGEPSPTVGQGDRAGFGAGLYNVGVMRLFNTTVSNNLTGNDDGQGGGVYSIGSVLTLTNCTVTGNSAPFPFGSGVQQATFGGGATTIQNTIVAQNISGRDTTGPFNSQGNNLIGDVFEATGFTSSDLTGTAASPVNAMLGALANNGGPTLTHALLAGSPALDAGNNALAVDANNAALATDQRGTGRIADSPDAGTTATVDIGAFELHQTIDSISSKTINEDTSLTLLFGVGDTGPAVTSVTATSTHQGLLPNANLVITGTGPVRTLTATPLANLSGSTTITVTVNLSGGGTANSSFLLTVLSVNDAPTFTKGANQTVNEDSGAKSITNWATGINPGAGEAGQTLSFIITNNTNPSLFSAGPAISSTGTLTYTPAANAFGSADVSVSLKDNGGTANGGQDTSAVQTFTITVNAVNDVPTFTKGPDQTVTEDPGFIVVPNWATNVSSGAPNEFQFVSIFVTNNTNPSLFSSPPSIGSSGTLNYMPAFNASGVADITFVARDNGGTANGGVDTSAPQTFRITVTPVNDAPSHGFPFFPFTNQQTPLVFSFGTGNTVSVFDADSGANAIRVTLSATDATLTMGSLAGLTFTTGDGTDDATMTFSGTVSSINAGLNGLTFKPNNGFSGVSTIQMVSNDNGHTGAGGPKSTSTSFNVQVASGGRLVFNSSLYSVSESGGTATITVLRGGGSAGTASVTAATNGGTATAGSSCTAGVDYQAAVHTFTWNNGDTSPRQFTVSICNDSVLEGDETINLTLDSPTGTGSLGTPSTAVLTIATDDGPVLLLNAETQEAIALDLVNQIRDPFSLTNPFNMSSDQRRRISLFVWQTAPLGSNEVASVTASMRDDQGRVYQLPVEALHPLVEVPGVTQVIVRLPDSVIGAPRDMLVKVTVKGLTTNEASIHVTSP